MNKPSAPNEPLIISASYRTDIPAFYSDWFIDRLRWGEAFVRNPYGSTVYRVALTPDAMNGFVFWTRNIAPFEGSLAAVEALELPYIVQYTVTGYPEALESGVPPAGHAVTQITKLSSRLGRHAVVWRYDPILLSSLTPPEWHRANFAALAVALAPHLDEVVISFTTFYQKTQRNLAAAARVHGFAWQQPAIAEQRMLVAELAEIAAREGLRLTVCSQPALEQPGADGAACIDTVRMSLVAGRRIGGRQKGNRPGCLCATSRDIGAYDTCAHGCRYCYAVRDHERARQTVRAADPRADRLLP